MMMKQNKRATNWYQATLTLNATTTATTATTATTTTKNKRNDRYRQ